MSRGFSLSIVAAALIAHALFGACFSPGAAKAQNMLAVASQAVGGVDPTARLDADTARILTRIEVETARSSRAEAEIAGLGQRRSETSTRLRTRARALYRLTRAGMLPLAGGFDALLGHLARLARLERMVGRDAVQLRELGTRGEALRAEIAGAADAIARSRGELRDLEAQKQQQLAAQRASLAFDAALSAAAAPAPQSDVGYGSIRLVDESADSASSGFVSLRGALTVPVSGDLRFAADASGDGSLSIEVAPGTSVRAVAAGRVVFADTQAGYGRLVILDHGDRFYTVYGGLSGLDVGVGDTLSRGSRVGAVSGSALRFEVRRGTRTLDARAWLGI
jgi:septal ring factor EnvC (AmiA/AmiB activator)